MALWQAARLGLLGWSICAFQCDYYPYYYYYCYYYYHHHHYFIIILIIILLLLLLLLLCCCCCYYYYYYCCCCCYYYYYNRLSLACALLYFYPAALSRVGCRGSRWLCGKQPAWGCLVGCCFTSQLLASVSYGRTCSDNCTCCLTTMPWPLERTRWRQFAAQ